MDVCRLSPSGRGLLILLLAGLWLPMVQLEPSRNVFLRRRSNPEERQVDVKSIELKAVSCNWWPCIHGSCTSDDRCSCDDGFKGLFCDEVSPCNSSTCIHGSCTWDSTCKCDDGFKGPTCDEVRSCNFKTCINGYCTPNDTCTCYYGFKGPPCEEGFSVNTAIGLMICLPIVTGILIILGIILCCCCSCKDTKMISTSAKVEENVYVDISVISSGRDLDPCPIKKAPNTPEGL